MVNCKDGEQLVEKIRIGGFWIQIIIVYLHVGSLCGWSVVFCFFVCFALFLGFGLCSMDLTIALNLYSFVACL